MVDFLIVGAGFSGCVLAHQIATKLNRKVLIIEKRSHIGGNAYDYYDDHGILIHKYGPHIFHTNSKKVFDFLSKFTEWSYYQHEVLAHVDGRKVPIPINLDTIKELYGLQLSENEMQEFYQSVREPIHNITNSEEVILSKVGLELYNKFYKNYTKKQWDLWPSELDASVCARIPVRTNRDRRYFSDKYQVMPKHGYTKMFLKMIDHPNIGILLQTDYQQIQQIIPHKYVIYTGPIDYFFNYKYGKLPYRSLNFHFETKDQERWQDAAVINYPNDYDYTRVTEFKYLTSQSHQKTTIVYEYPTNNGDPYYPIPKKDNMELYQMYKQEAEKLKNVWFLGRLGTYKYYNMDQVVAQALTLFERELQNL
ncbi:UDP-galactopyranose mutase [Anaerobacillus arseniciselenatis]|uniref:UDP-galactopyranose mutase n=1 Tax=Anaerobacillus arseniciselenatis TaxID=85682 RepID=A0A1S2LE27_9BACI|nr:UDP-galactopyranose mutase [Anaerobacillus arseniciselenatis]OIJ10772.1 UDP-galactopyranose mutase [Anaerobacillus arseniciselenatis]